ncbi:MAG: hypothetical protein ACREH8_00175, partial [Opitutaceae bacterium]
MAELGRLFAVLNSIGKRPENECFNLRNRFLLGRTVCHGSSKRRDLSNPAPVLFLFDFYVHEETLFVSRKVRKRVLFAQRQRQRGVRQISSREMPAPLGKRGKISRRLDTFLLVGQRSGNQFVLQL